MNRKSETKPIPKFQKEANPMSKKIASCNNANTSNDNSASKIQNAHVHENLNDDELVSLLAGVLSLEIKLVIILFCLESFRGRHWGECRV